MEVNAGEAAWADWSIGPEPPATSRDKSSQPPITCRPALIGPSCRTPMAGAHRRRGNRHPSRLVGMDGGPGAPRVSRTAYLRLNNRDPRLMAWGDDSEKGVLYDRHHWCLPAGCARRSPLRRRTPGVRSSVTKRAAVLASTAGYAEHTQLDERTLFRRLGVF